MALRWLEVAIADLRKPLGVSITLLCWYKIIVMLTNGNVGHPSTIVGQPM